LGKIFFPLANIRKDVVNEWHLNHIRAEKIEVPSEPNEYGYFTVSLTEIPDNGTNTSITTSAPKITGMTEFRGEPINRNTKRVNFAINQFFVNYQTGEIMFHQSQAGKTLFVDYFAKGSLVEAEDINYLHDRILALENAQFQPEFRSFSLHEAPSHLEVGQYFPVGNTLVVPIRFAWEILRPELIVDESIFISLGNRKIASNLPTSIRATTVDFDQPQAFNEPASLEFFIYGTSISDASFSNSLKVTWTDRIFYGTSTDTIVTRTKVTRLSSNLLDSIDKSQVINFTCPEETNSFKIFALPKRYNIRYILDNKTGFRFAFNDPVEITITNNYNVVIPYNVYLSSYRVSPEVELKVEVGD